MSYVFDYEIFQKVAELRTSSARKGAFFLTGQELNTK